MSDRSIRSIVKGLSYRILATTGTCIIGFILTSNIQIALSIGAMEFVAKILLFWVHERVWNRIKWGID